MYGPIYKYDSSYKIVYVHVSYDICPYVLGSVKNRFFS